MRTFWGSRSRNTQPAVNSSPSSGVTEQPNKTPFAKVPVLGKFLESKKKAPKGISLIPIVLRFGRKK